MNGNEILTLGLGLEKPWKITGQLLDTSSEPHELKLTVSAPRGAEFPCPVCGKSCKAHDFKEFTWRHLNFFQHRCYITASIPRIRCEEHGVKRIEVPWARKGSKFTLLFEQVAMTLVREMPVLAAARIMGITDKRLWSIVFHYVSLAMAQLSLQHVTAIGLDETAAKRGHKYVTVFIDLDREKNPVLFATPGKGKETLREFRRFLELQGGKAENIVEVVCDMSKAFLAGAKEQFQQAEITIDWFHVVQLFTSAVDKVRRKEAKQRNFPKALRWATLKSADAVMTESQLDALAELVEMNCHTATAWRIKEMLRWVRKAKTPRAAKWRITNFVRYAMEQLDDSPLLQPVYEALETLLRHRDRILARWNSGRSNARLEGLNSLFQAARARARGYRNTATFITMMYLIAAPIGDFIEFHTF